MSQVGARKQSGWLVVCETPDVCKTPIGSSTPPVPYMVTAQLSNCVSEVPSVRINGHPVVVFDQTQVPTTLGDQAGIALGSGSNTVGAACWPIEHSQTVKAGKRYFVRHDDRFGMNGS